jgi:hypothetical protein
MQNSKIVSNVTDKSAWVTARGREKTGGSAASKTRKIAIVTVTHRQNPNTSQSKYDARAEDRATTQTSASNSDTGIVFFLRGCPQGCPEGRQASAGHSSICRMPMCARLQTLATAA